MCSAAYIRPIRPMHFRIIMTVSGVRADLALPVGYTERFSVASCGQARAGIRPCVVLGQMPPFFAWST